MSLKNWSLFTLLGLIWGSAFMWIKIAVHEISPNSLVVIRVTIALLTTIAMMLIFHHKPPPRNKWWVFAFLGAFNIAFPFMLISWAEKHIPSALAAIMNGTPPLFTMIIATFMLKNDPFTWRKLIGLLIGFSGILILMSPELGQPMSNYTWGILAMLLAAFFYGLCFAFAKKFAQGFHPISQGFAQSLSACLIMWPVAASQIQPFNLPVTPLGWFAVIFLGIFATGIASTISYALINSVGATKASMVAYVFPVVGAILGVTIMREPFTWSLFFGCVVILLGVIIVNSQKPVQSVHD